MPIVALILLLIVSTAQAVVPFRLVTEIQLPARTIQWDVQHFEDSTSFGWVAITQGMSIWGVDTLGRDSLISHAVDTIWYKANTLDPQHHFLFPVTEFDPWCIALNWAGLRLMRYSEVPGVSAIARAVAGAEDSDQYLYYFHLDGDSVLRRQVLSSSSWDFYYLKGVEIWPRPPSVSEYILIMRIHDYYREHTGWSEWVQTASSFLIRMSDNAYIYPAPGFQIDIFDHDQSLAYSFFGGTERYLGPIYQPHFNFGLTTYTGSFETNVIDTISYVAKIIAQRDNDGTKRVLLNTGECYNATTGEIVFSNPLISDTCLSAYIRNAPGEDFLVFGGGRFQIYDGRTGNWVDSTSEIEGIPKYTLVTSGFDELVTYDATTKLVRVYQACPTLLSIAVIDGGHVRLRWTPNGSAVGYQLDVSRDSDFTEFDSDYFDEATTSAIIQTAAPIRFFRVTPLFE